MGVMSKIDKRPHDYCDRCNKFRRIYSVSGRKAEVFATCGHQVYWTAGTIMRQSTTPYEKWQTAFHLLDRNPDLPVDRLARSIEVNWRTARRIKGLILHDIEDAAILLGN